MITTLKRTLTWIAAAGALGCAVDDGATRVADFVSVAAQHCAIRIAMHRYALEQPQEATRPSALHVQDAETVEPAIAKSVAPPQKPSLSVRAEMPAESIVEPLPIVRDLASIEPRKRMILVSPARTLALSTAPLPEVIVVSPRAHSISDCPTRRATA